MDAPERIYADICEVSVCGSYDVQPFNDATEYIRADLCADPALLAEAVEALRGAVEWMACVEGHLRDGQPFKRNITHYRSVIAKLEARHDR